MEITTVDITTILKTNSLLSDIFFTNNIGIVNTGELVHTARSKDAFVPVNRARRKMCFIYSKSESMAWPLAA